MMTKNTNYGVNTNNLSRGSKDDKMGSNNFGQQ